MCLFYTNVPVYLRFILGLMASMLGVYVIWVDILLRGQRSVVSLTCCDDNTWQIKERAREAYPAALCGDSTIMGICCILRFKAYQGVKKRSCVIFSDAVGIAGYRRILMMLRTMKVKEE